MNTFLYQLRFWTFAKMHLLMNLVRDDRISFRYIELYIELYEINHRDSKKLETLGNKF